MAIRLLPKRLIGQTIRGVRTRLGQTQEQFAESLGLESGSTVSAWETGEAQPDYGTLAKIGAMGLVDVLVFHDDAPGEDGPQLTPGEAVELRGIVDQMDALLAEVRRIVERAESRTVVELLEAAAGRAPAQGELEADGAVAVSAELVVRPRTRKSSGGASADSGTSKGGRSGGTRPGGKSGSASSGTGGGTSRTSSSKTGGSARSSSDTGSGGGSRSRGGSSSAGGSSTSSGSRSGSGSKSSGGSTSSGGSSPGGSSASGGSSGSKGGGSRSGGRGSSTGSRGGGGSSGSPSSGGGSSGNR